jgi:hypothetical protein
MYFDQTMLGLPKCPFPKQTCQCPICALASLNCPPRGEFFDSSLLCCGQLLHIDFAFWDKVSICGTGVLSIIDASTQMLWVFGTAAKCPPLEFLEENIQPHTVRVDEDGALACSSKFTHFLLTHHLTLDTSSYNSCLNGMVEHTDHATANKAHY